MIISTSTSKNISRFLFFCSARHVWRIKATESLCRNVKASAIGGRTRWQTIDAIVAGDFRAVHIAVATPVHGSHGRFFRR
jgi:hypothetical protein